MTDIEWGDVEVGQTFYWMGFVRMTRIESGTVDVDGEPMVRVEYAVTVPGAPKTIRAGTVGLVRADDRATSHLEPRSL